MVEEVFADFPLEEYKKRYKVSNQGRIWSNRKNDYLLTIISNGFSVFCVNKSSSKTREQFRLDIIIAKTFLGDGEYLEHIDGNILNNNIDNLRWNTYTKYLREQYKCNWKSIIGYNNYYVSDTGIVWSAYSTNIIKQRIVSGYNSVNIGYPKSMFKHVHRLVAMAFIPNPLNLPVVNHKDLDKFNNRLDNLDWVSSSENRIHYLNVNIKTTRQMSKYSKQPDFSVELDDLPGYLICDNGLVYSTKSNMYIKLHVNNNGYYRVNVNNNFKYVHKLVATAYLPIPTPEKTQVNHKNRDRLDNRVENLEWCSPSENNKHSVDTNPLQYKHLQKKVARLDIDTDNILETYDGIKVASRLSGVNSGSIVKVCKGIQKAAGGFKWIYVV